MAAACRRDNTNDIKPGTEASTSRDTLALSTVENWHNAMASSTPIRTNNTSAPSFRLADASIDWSQAVSMPSTASNYWLIAMKGTPTFQGVGQGYRKIAFYADKHHTLHARILEFIPDANWLQRQNHITPANYTGRIFVFDEAYNLLGGRIFSEGKSIGEAKPAKTNDIQPSIHINNLQPTTDCYWVDHNYINGEGVLVIYSEQICTTTYTDIDGPYGGMDPGGSSGGFDPGHGGYATPPADSSVPSVSNLPGEEKPGIKPRQLMDCFNNVQDAGATMSVTVYVQEPQPGTYFNIGKNSVGHTAIGLTKANGSNSITQVVGFYPDATGMDKMHAPSKIVDNSILDYNVSITFNVNAVNFRHIIDYISSPPVTYDLTQFNCTNFVIEACLKGGIILPDATNTVGLSGPGGAMTAQTPAALGANLEKMNGDNINKNGGTAPSSKGACN
ncbi:hypothetical protein BC343_11830 [Mucilaginibacter pedocola]|uniref:Uncharacterized protein n=1 Tax=Mucilaginibacter pedocola TaxID=1792845 RepID=A0A1S9PBY7_9SPHI|nr:hypothetical protein BC343_11830 [Mucilaginibacter pedocola]